VFPVSAYNKRSDLIGLKSSSNEGGLCVSRLEVLTLLLSLKALLKTGNAEEAENVIDEVIKEAKREKS
jgi:hypothetical protein